MHAPSPRRTPRSRRAPGFTLIELLTVVAIVGILAAILIPVAGRARRLADDTQCRSALRQWGIAVNLYMNDNKGYLPGPLNTGVSAYSSPENTTSNHLGTKLAPYFLPSSTKNMRIPDSYVCRGWAREKTAADPALWLLAHTVPKRNGSGNFYPWGYPTNTATDPDTGRPNNKPNLWMNLDRHIDIRTARALRDIDKGISTSDGLPATPVHGNHRNVLYLDWHIGQEAL